MESAERGTRAKPTTSGTDLDVKGVDAQILASSSNVLSSQHGSVRGGFVTVSLDLHTASDAGDGLATTIQDVSSRNSFIVAQT